jgi:addiction module RelE/StbE family toxin
MQVRYTRQANSDLDQAYEYIVSDSPQNAGLVIARMEQAVDLLRSYPKLGKTGRVENTREFFVLNTPFIIIYRHLKNTLQILSVLHTSRKYP